MQNILAATQVLATTVGMIELRIGVVNILTMEQHWTIFDPINSIPFPNIYKHLANSSTLNFLRRILGTNASYRGGWGKSGHGVNPATL